MLGIRDRSLKNGLRLITIKKPGALMAVNFGIASGAMYDPPELKGISHFMEHMLFTGTTNRTHGAINEEFEALGGDVNAFTDLTATVLSASALDSELPGALAVIADLLRNSIFPEIETERDGSSCQNTGKAWRTLRPSPLTGSMRGRFPRIPCATM